MAHLVAIAHQPGSEQELITDAGTNRPDVDDVMCDGGLEHSDRPVVSSGRISN
jgi:hypothetical protein